MKVKKIIAILLVMICVMTGAGIVENKKSEVHAASTETNTDMLNVKIQIATDGTKVMRFITSVDHLQYNRVGFEIDTPEDPMDEPILWDTQTVFERIVSTEDSVKYEFSPKVVSTKAEYFATAKMKVESGTLYTVRAFVKTMDGEMVYGQSRCVATDDSDQHIMNLSIDKELSTSDDYTVSYDGKNAKEFMILPSEEGRTNVRIVLPDAESVSKLPSATKIVINDANGEVASAVYRNYYSTYGAEQRADTSWYTVNPSATEFVIASNADLWGLATLVNAGTDLFQNNTVTLVRDVTVNSGKVVVSNDGMAVADYAWSGDTTNWPKIGVSATNNFNGTFDGDGNVISGVYANYSNPQANHSGFFGYIGTSSCIKNFTLKNSLIDADYNTGGVVGVCKGSLENIYVDLDTYIKMQDAGDYQGAGFIGIVDNPGRSITVRNCWFNGTVANNGFRTGGFIARVYKGTVTMENCLNTGTVISTKTGNDPKVGGMVGGVDTEGALNMIDCVSAGEVYAASVATVGSVIGRVQASRPVSFDSVYTTNKRALNGDFESSFNASSYTGIGSASEVALTGIGFVKTDAELAGENGYVNTALDFYETNHEEGVWVATDHGPELKMFSVATNPVNKFTNQRATLGWYYREYVNGALPTVATTFEIDTADDMLGLASLVNNKTDVFAGDTIVLTKSIDANPGWTAGANLPTGGTVWTPIGTHYGEGKAFKGIFDGNNYTISGIYLNVNAQNTGLFGDIAGTVKNFTISNSYIKNEGILTGAVAGRLSMGRVENIYVDETVTVKGASVTGGIIGRFSFTKTENGERISNCRFDGTVIGTDKVGGILAQTWYTSNDTIILDNCMFNGKIEASSNIVGGLIGHNDHGSIAQYCLSIGTICSSAKTYLGAVVGHKASALTTQGVYATENIFKADGVTPNELSNTDTYTLIDKAELKANAVLEVPELFDTEKTTSWSVDANGLPTLKWLIEE